MGLGKKSKTETMLLMLDLDCAQKEISIYLKIWIMRHSSLMERKSGVLMIRTKACPVSETK